MRHRDQERDLLFYDKISQSTIHHVKIWSCTGSTLAQVEAEVEMFQA